MYPHDSHRIVYDNAYKIILNISCRYPGARRRDDPHLKGTDQTVQPQNRISYNKERKFWQYSLSLTRFSNSRQREKMHSKKKGKERYKPVQKFEHAPGGKNSIGEV